MGCEQLQSLLNTLKSEEKERHILYERIAVHIQSCSDCRLGGTGSMKSPSSQFTCEQCRERFPDYYEATRPEYPLVEMAHEEILAMMSHLASCETCAVEYAELVLLSELEERDEQPDI